MRQFFQDFRTRFPRRGRVLATEMVTHRMRRIRIADPTLRRLPWQPGQHVRVHVIPQERYSHDALRTYSVWQYDAEAGIIDLCVLLQGNGPGSRWAQQIQAGEAVMLFGPTGKFVLEPNAPWYLFAGEETAAVTFQAMLRDLPPEARVYGYMEGESPDDQLPALPNGHTLPWVYRQGLLASPSQGLVDAMHRLALPPEPGLAYLAGETQTCLALRDYLLRERGWPKERVRVKPYWEPGRTGLE